MILVSIQLSIRCRWIHPPPPPRTARVAWSFGEGGVELGRGSGQSKDKIGALRSFHMPYSH